jgi:hypothetical protein
VGNKTHNMGISRGYLTYELWTTAILEDMVARSRSVATE